MTVLKLNHRPQAKSFHNLFDEFLQEFPATWSKDAQLPVPAVNIYEAKDGYHLELNAAGRNKEDFIVNLEKGILTVGYVKKEETPNDALKTVRKEFSNNSFSRNFTVDEKIDADKIQAKYENGLLKLYLPKKEEVKTNPKKISIE